MAGVYLASAIAEYTGERCTIIEFNDRQGSFDDIGRVISVARHRAQAVVDSYAFAEDLTAGSPAGAVPVVEAGTIRKRCRILGRQTSGGLRADQQPKANLWKFVP